MNIGAIILAAGYSSRMNGGFKPLMPLGGRTLLAHCAQIFQGAGLGSITVVSGHRGEEVAAEAARLGLECLPNPRYDQGMFSSIRHAVARMQQLDGFFLLPVDIPLIYPATAARLIACFDGQSVIVPVFNGQQGHPPLIPARLIPAILDHDGEGGLRTVLAARPQREIPVWDRGILMDADTPGDFAALETRFSRLGTGEPDEAMVLATLLMPQPGVAHGRTVARVAGALGRRLNSRGHGLDLDLLHNAALLHDVGKGAPAHEIRGGKMLDRLGLTRLAGIVAAHRSLPPPAAGVLTEKEIVCLADKLIRGASRVSVQHRFAEKLARYAHDVEVRELIQQRLADTLALQTMVEQLAGCTIAEMLPACPA